ncbi:heme anaerobic degradation radical SAM methyltransferase ChuW/HutW [Deefgea sp. CFH1-16]|uniref:heme anaerobic degradation radical SAM methyltransferase ChuW/HutW n=1 Tax=Deefgea sp. CFH1-16 TaxID=2675457 RepID=UPI0027DB44E7|nr:heme anaerobic degradation radical SAM methyltransferase ChuW/HutW [Deefgea sp. CFH1-16]
MKPFTCNNDVLPDAFTERKALMPMWGANPIPAEQWPQMQATLTQAAISDGALAYFHIPFCANHCVFCGFYRNAWQEKHGTPYTDRLIAELAQDASTRPAGGSIQALYFGGGTPTALSANDLTRLLSAARQYLPLTDDCEITIEGRISHFDRDKVNACLAAGANRISIGVQSFDSQLRRRLGRHHSGEAAADYLRALCQDCDAVIVADLMLGLPGQDDEKWTHDLDVALSLGLSGLDIYAFNAFPSLPINRMIAKGALKPLPDLATQARQYAYAVHKMQAAGWVQVSNSHFANPQKNERNRYNNAIKTGHDCLAFGSGAGGCHSGLSYQVQGELTAYLASTSKPLSYIAGVSDKKRIFGQIQGELDRGVLSLERLAAYPAALEKINDWQVAGLLNIDDQHAALSIAGRFWSPTLTRELAVLL